MKSNKIMFIIIGVCAILVIGFCAFLILTKEDEEVLSDALKFKQEFEQYNGATYSGGYDGELIEVSIPEDNPFIYKSANEIVDIMKNEDAYILFGYATDPITRKSIEVLINALKEKEINTVYYVDIENIRDEYSISWPTELINEGTESYQEIKEILGDVLNEYYVNDFANNMRYDTGDVGLYSPTFIAISKGTVLGFHEIVNEVLDNYYEELSDSEKETVKTSYLEVIDSLNSSEN